MPSAVVVRASRVALAVLAVLAVLALGALGPASARAQSGAQRGAQSDSSLPPERGHFVEVGPGGLRVHLRHQPPSERARRRGAAPVLFVHGSTFPSGLAAAFRLDGVSWMSDLAAQGFDVWALDFLGYGESDRYPEMREPAAAHPPLGRSPDAARQIAAAVEFIAARRGSGGSTGRVSLVAHSWGTLPAGRYAGEHPGRVERLVLFGPVARRDGTPAAAGPLAAYGFVSVEQQRARFASYVPEGEAPVLDPRHFALWGPAYVATDSTAATRTPPSVQVPDGPSADVADAWAGRLAYDPAAITAPTLIVRGEWEAVTTDADARWLFDALVRAPLKRDVKIDRATHVMHLERGRFQLYREVALFLAGGDTVPASRARDGGGW